MRRSLYPPDPSLFLSLSRLALHHCSPFSRFTVRFAPVFLPNANTRNGYRGEYNHRRLHPDERDDEREELTIRQFKSTRLDRPNGAGDRRASY